MKETKENQTQPAQETLKKRLNNDIKENGIEKNNLKENNIIEESVKKVKPKNSQTTKDYIENTIINAQEKCQEANLEILNKNSQEETENDTTQNRETENNIIENGETEKINYKTLSFWVSVVCFAMVGLQTGLTYMGIVFETKILIEIASFVLAFFVSMGIIKFKHKSKSLTELQKEINDEINKNTKKD